MASLRYFNPVGAHPSGRIGEDPNGIPNNLFPSSPRSQQADSITACSATTTPPPMAPASRLHVMDLAEAHTTAVEHLPKTDAPASLKLNLGTGQAKVLDVVKGFEASTGITIPYEIVERPGDVPKPGLPKARR